MIVHRILDAVFRTLDTVDAIRARVDNALGRAEDQPPSQWPAVIEDDRAPVDATEIRAAYAPIDLDAWKDKDNAPGAVKTSPAASPAAAKKRAATTTTSKATAKKAAPSKLPTSAKKTTTKKAAAKKNVSNRKGSVDRQGRDLDSPRATEIAAWIANSGAAVVTEAADLDGKRTLARVLWALAMAEQAGTTDGLTSADASALLSVAADVEVFSTNVARAFRDEATLFVETTPDGRSKRYTLTAAGRARLGEVATH